MVSFVLVTSERIPSGSALLRHICSAFLTDNRRHGEGSDVKVMAIKDKHLVRELNGLLQTTNLPEVRSISEISPNLLIVLYEVLKQGRLNGYDRKDHSRTARIQSVKCLLQAISKDLVTVDLCSLDPRKICQNDPKSVCHLLDIMIPLCRILRAKIRRREIETEPSGIDITGETTDTPLTQDLSAQTDNTSIVTNSTIECQDDATSILDEHSTKVSTSSSLATTARVHRAERRELKEGRRVAKGHQRRMRCSNQCTGTLKRGNRGHRVADNECPHKNIVAHAAPLGRDYSRPPNLETVVPKHRLDFLYTTKYTAPSKAQRSAPSMPRQVPTFASPSPSVYDSDSLLTPRPGCRSFLVDSPYTKYRKARKVAAISELRAYDRWRNSRHGDRSPALGRSIRQGTKGQAQAQAQTGGQLYETNLHTAGGRNAQSLQFPNHLRSSTMSNNSDISFYDDRQH